MHCKWQAMEIGNTQILFSDNEVTTSKDFRKICLKLLFPAKNYNMLTIPFTLTNMHVFNFLYYLSM